MLTILFGSFVFLSWTPIDQDSTSIHKKTIQPDSLRIQDSIMIVTPVDSLMIQQKEVREELLEIYKQKQLKK
jgi:hypothetical protein